MKRGKVITLVIFFLFILSFAVATEFKVTDGIITIFQVLKSGTVNVSADMEFNGSDITGVREYRNASDALDWIRPENVFDIDDEDVETDLNTYVDIAGDKTTGDVNISTEINMSAVDGNVQVGGNLTGMGVNMWNNGSCFIINGSSSSLAIC